MFPNEDISKYKISEFEKAELYFVSRDYDKANKLYNDFTTFQQNQKTQVQSASYSGAMSSADGQYQLIKSQLGNYPSNLVMDTTSAKQNLLSDLVDKSMVQGKLNVNVSVAKPTSL